MKAPPFAAVFSPFRTQAEMPRSTDRCGDSCRPRYDLCPAELPGRAARLAEPPFMSMSALMEETLDFKLPRDLEAREPAELRGAGRDDVRLQATSLWVARGVRGSAILLAVIVRPGAGLGHWSSGGGQECRREH